MSQRRGGRKEQESWHSLERRGMNKGWLVKQSDDVDTPAVERHADRSIRSDEKTAADYQLEGGNTLHLVLALRGGC